MKITCSCIFLSLKASTACFPYCPVVVSFYFKHHRELLSKSPEKHPPQTSPTRENFIGKCYLLYSRPPFIYMYNFPICVGKPKFSQFSKGFQVFLSSTGGSRCQWQNSYTDKDKVKLYPFGYSFFYHYYYYFHTFFDSLKLTRFIALYIKKKVIKSLLPTVRFEPSLTI